MLYPFHMRKRSPSGKISLGLAILLAGCLLPAFADYSLSASLGFYPSVRLGKLTPLPQTADVPDVKVLLESAGPELSFSFGYEFSPRVEGHLYAGSVPTRVIDDVGIGLAGIPLGETKVTDALFWNFGLRILYGFGEGKLSPYLAAGFGASVLETRKIGTKTRPSVELAAGVKIRISDQLRADLEVRDAVSFFRYFDDFGIAYAMIYTAESQKVQHRLGARATLRYFLPL